MAAITFRLLRDWVRRMRKIQIVADRLAMTLLDRFKRVAATTIHEALHSI
jgi:hypothetical protein